MTQKLSQLTLSGELSDEDLVSALDTLESSGKLRIEGVVRPG